MVVGGVVRWWEGWYSGRGDAVVGRECNWHCGSGWECYWQHTSRRQWRI